MLPRYQVPPVATSYGKLATTYVVSPLTATEGAAGGTPSSDVDCTTSTSTSSVVPPTTSVLNCNVVGPHLTPVQGAVIALSILCAAFLVGLAVLACFFRRLKEGRETRRRDGATTPPLSPNGSYPLVPDLRDFDQRGLRRRRVYDGLGIIGQSRDGRIRRRHSVHGTPLHRSGVVTPRQGENVIPDTRNNTNGGIFTRLPAQQQVQQQPQPQQHGLFPGVPGYSQFMRNTMPFDQVQNPYANAQGFGAAMVQPQAPMMQREEQFQHGMQGMRPDIQIPSMLRNDGEQIHGPGSRRGEHDAGSPHGSPRQGGRNEAAHEDIFTRIQRQAMASRRMSRAETEGSRGSRGRGGRGDRFGDGGAPAQL